MCHSASPADVGLVQRKAADANPDVLEATQAAVYQPQTAYVDFALKCHALLPLVDDVPYRIRIALATSGHTATEVVESLESVHIPTLLSLCDGAMQRKKQAEIREIDVRNRRLEDLQREKQALEDRLAAKIQDISALEEEIAQQRAAIDKEAGQHERVTEIIHGELAEVLGMVRSLTCAPP